MTAVDGEGVGFIPCRGGEMLNIAGACTGGNLRCFASYSRSKQQIPMLQVDFVMAMWIVSNDMSV